MLIDFITCDVFTDRPFTGNPLLVVPDARGMSTEQMQSVAREINYSESTFVLPPKDPRHAYLQRTFVPVKEIPYAGHPTVGTAVVMASLGKVGGVDGAEISEITIEVGFGPLKLQLMKKDGAVSRVRMEQGKPSWSDPIDEPELLGKIAAALNVPYEELVPSHPTAGPLKPQAVSTGNRMLMVPLRSVDAVSKALYDVKILSLIEKELTTLCAYLFAFTEDGRIRARAFCAGAGVPEDPATGSAAGPLGIYLALHGALPGKGPFVIDQGVEMGRPSELEVEAVVENGAPVGVRVAGSAVLVMKGSLEV